MDLGFEFLRIERFELGEQIFRFVRHAPGFEDLGFALKREREPIPGLVRRKDSLTVGAGAGHRAGTESTGPGWGTTAP